MMKKHLYNVFRKSNQEDKTKFKQSSHHNLVKSYINYDMKNYFVQIPKYKMK